MSKPQVHRLMVIDDDPAEVFLIKRALSDPNCHLPGNCALDVQMDGGKALRKLENFAASGELPDLILLDLNMPGIDGFDILSRCAGRPEFMSTPMVVITTASEPSMLQRARELGASDAYTKPYASEDSVGLFSKVISKYLN